MPTANAIANAPAPKGIKARRGRQAAAVTKDQLRAINPNGNTVLTDFGRILRDEPHKNIYTLKLYVVRNELAAKPVLDWLRERYIEAKGRGKNHNTRYEVRTYKGADNKRYVDYILLEQMTEDERVEFTLRFGDVTDEKIIRDGKLRRLRLKKEEKKALDAIINDYYLKVAEERRQARLGSQA